MTKERLSTPRRPRPDRRPAVTAAVTVLLSALALALGPTLTGQAPDRPTSRDAATTAPTRGPADAPGRGASIEQVSALGDATTTESPPTPTPSDSAPATVAPSPTPTSDPTASPAPPPPEADPSTTPAPAPNAVPQPLAPPSPVTLSLGLHGGPVALATLGAPGSAPVYLPAGRPLTDALPFQVFRVAVQLGNGGPADAAVAPRLEYRVAGEGAYREVPETAVPGIPLHAATEWVPATVGTTPAPPTTTTAADQAHLAAPSGATRAQGHRSSGAVATPRYTVGAGTVTEQEFTVTLSVDAAYGTTYELRVTDDGTAVRGLASAQVTVADVPRLVLSPGQRQGSTPDGSPPRETLAGLPAYPLVSPSTTTAASATNTALVSPTATYTLTIGVVGPAGPGTIHDPYSSTTSGQCGVCHGAHTARSGALVKAPTTTEQCYTCHADGVGGADVKAQYTLGQPANDPTTRSYWSHDTADATGHSLDSANEFEGKLARHSQCTDCHDPHGTTATASTMTATGWTAPGGLSHVSGVGVTNGAAGTTPTYTWLDGTVAPVTAEYQLCFKCHSGYTTLPADVPGKPSQNVTDLAVAFNPSNSSYHPVEAPGRNQTQKLADSLAGTSPYKLWNFSTGDTVRCVSCHASDTTGTSPDPAQNVPGATLTVHASTNRGILTRPYENRVLSPAGQFYDNTGFALCLTCHMETPFMNRYRPAAAEGTNFVFHGLHMAGITSKGSGGLDIDTPGAGQGNARCAECHFSGHGTTAPPSAQKVSGDRLVVFAPDVLPSRSMGGVPTFTKTATGASCTLTCHGKDHQGATYTP